MQNIAINAIIIKSGLYLRSSHTEVYVRLNYSQNKKHLQGSATQQHCGLSNLECCASNIHYAEAYQQKCISS